jgi:hypothetical protein
MAHDVFISYSTHDKPYAEAVCVKLESRGIRCWTAPRDIRPGMSWGGAIVEAIDGARLMLLLFSSHANGSPQIKREVERAVHEAIVIVPVRVEDVNPTGDFAYFLGTPHWLDAITPPFERHLDTIADSAKFWLERIESDGATPEAPRPIHPARNEPNAAALSTRIARVRTRPKWIVLSIVAFLIALVGAAAFCGTRYYFAQQEVYRGTMAGIQVAIDGATNAGDEWLKLVDNGDYSWNAGSGVAAARKLTGALVSRERKSAQYFTSLPGAPDGTYVVIQFDSSFQNKRDAVEMLTLTLDRDRQWRVYGYHIQ